MVRYGQYRTALVDAAEYGYYYVVEERVSRRFLWWNIFYWKAAGPYGSTPEQAEERFEKERATLAYQPRPYTPKSL